MSERTEAGMPDHATDDMTVAQHKDRFRGRCALALDWNAKITLSLANAIRISPMRGCTDLGAIQACREHMAEMAKWLNDAEESARAVARGEARAARPESPEERHHRQLHNGELNQMPPEHA